MKILITGHKGFLGSEFIKRYGHEYEIVGFDFEYFTKISDERKADVSVLDKEYFLP